MELKFEGEVTASLHPPRMVGNTPHGIRMFIEVGEGKLEGARINGRVLPGGGDWVLIGTDQWARADVRVQFETDDGAIIYAQFDGLIEMTDAVQTAFADGVPTAFEDQYFRVLPRLETGDPDYEWVNQTLFVGEGRFTEGFGLQYRFYRIT
ncbi:DUF3237 domain-containing protein [Nocardia sp. NBC_00565]|uniref:DUF3237 domain-containing protein n=1 Tax=Nocardia sp. NBC_00565 TaxID=2975993 RepID=UPI002E80B8E4|nr:DUF3237 domain-containing protein [Nocardia sp. NBC_00565]WUC00886.1 DUF3237 domain-containing protein [Nocardia sp. NBC_00565]